MFRPLLIIALLLASIQSFCQPFGNEWIDYSKTYYKFPVNTTQLCRITKATLVAANLGDVQAEHFQLWRNGKEIPIYTTQPTGSLATDGFIEFAGVPNDGKAENVLYLKPEYQPYDKKSLFTDTSWYYLTSNVGANLRLVATDNNVATTSLVADSFFYDKKELFVPAGILGGYAVEAGGRWDSALGRNVDATQLRSSAFDQGEGWVYYRPFKIADSFRTSLGNMRMYTTKDRPIMVTYSATGLSLPGKDVLLYMNDSLIGRKAINGYQMIRDTISGIPLSRIINDAATFKLTTNNTEDVYAISLTVSYPRSFHMAGAGFYNFNLPANNSGNHLRIANFARGSAAPIVYDFKNLKRYVGTFAGDSIFFLLEPSSTERNISLLKADFGATKLIPQLNAVAFTDFSQSTNQADFVIISNRRLFDYNGRNYVEEYRSYRSSSQGGGYNAKIFDIDDLAEQFAFGQRKNPLAIKNFVRFLSTQAGNNPQTIKPKYIFLIGKGSLYKDYRTSPGTKAEYFNAVPTFGQPASDNLLASADNYNSYPLVPIGRLSAINGKEIGDYLNKVKQYEALAASTSFTPENKEWKKEVVQIVGADRGDEFLSAVITSFMGRYTSIITDTLLGARAKTYVKLSPNYANEALDMKTRIDSGVGLINYFGHRFAFNLDNPELYGNANGKYPIFIANGCETSQDVFTYQDIRSTYFGLSVPDRFLLYPNKGAIAFISGSDFGVPNYLNLFTTEWYRAAARDLYGSGIGNIHQQTIQNAMAVTGTGDMYNRMNCEQNILLGDPAVVAFPNSKPDFTTTDSLITIKPFASVAEDSLEIKAKFYNLGKGIRDSVWVELKRQFPDGHEQTITRQILRSNILKSSTNQDSISLLLVDSVSAKIAVKGNFDKGTNYIIATIDPANQLSEMTETNNEGRMSFEVSDEELRPVYPYKYAIINQPNFLLTGSTANAVKELRTYRLQLDTTEYFNSSLLYTKDTTLIGGAVAFAPPTTWQNGSVYYWRLAPVLNGQPVNWRKSSFQYLTGISAGFGQSHFFQHLQSGFKGTKIDTADRQFKFGPKNQNLYAVNSVYGYSGEQESEFSLSVNGDMSMRSSCSGIAITFNVFDTVTFKPWLNLDGRFGSTPFCGSVFTQYNFSYRYDLVDGRKKMMDFIDSLPKGVIVSARLVLDATGNSAGKPIFDSSFSQYWKRDTVLYGPGKSLYHSLYNQGFYNLDSMNRPRTFAFIFRKDDSAHFRPFPRLSDGLYDKINMNVFLTTNDTIGQVTSPIFGPAANWKELQWQGHEQNPLFVGQNQLQLIGIDNSGKETVLKTYLPEEWVNDISSVSAAQYPYLRLKLLTINLRAIPYQLDYWRLFYTPVPDGALSALDYYEFNKPILVTAKDTLKIKLAFKNVSKSWLDSTSVKVQVGNKDSVETTYMLNKLKPLNPGDTAIISFSTITNGMDGLYYAYIGVNDEQLPIEQNRFNNFVYIPFEVAAALPLTLVDFTAKAEQDAARVNWNVAFESDVASYTLEHATTGAAFESIAEFKAINNSAANTTYTWLHSTPSLGLNYYRIKTIYNSGKIEYTQVRQVTFDKEFLVIAYPNPFKDVIKIVGKSSNQNNVIQLFNIQGQRVMLKNCTGSCFLNTQHLPAGIYTLKINNDVDKTIKLEKH